MAFWHIFLGVQMKKLLITILMFILMAGILSVSAQEEIDPLGDPVIMDSSGTGHTYHSYDWLGDPSTHSIYGSSFYRYSYYPYGSWNPYSWYNVYSYPSYRYYYYSWYPMTYRSSLWYPGTYSGIYMR